MKTASALNQAIISVLSELKQRFPELPQYLLEMPVVGANPKTTSSNVSNKNLRDYYDSLQALLQHYAITHPRLGNEFVAF